MFISIPSHLTDDDLMAEVTRLAQSTREEVAHLVGHLAELDGRHLYLGAGFRSLYTYCREVLRFSEHEAYNRIEAARVARKFPVILAMLSEGQVNLTCVRLLAPHLTAENHLSLLAEAVHKSKIEVGELLARWFPQPDVATSIRKLPAPKAMSSDAPKAADETVAEALSSGSVAGGLNLAEAGSFALASPPAPASAPPTARLSTVSPLAPDRYQIKFTANAQMVEKLRLAQELLSHAVPSGDVAEIFDRALTALLEKAARRKYAATDQPRPGRETTPDSRHIPAAVAREVWKRDGGRCAFVAKGGRRCSARRFLEFHHHGRPWAVGGPATVENIELRCRAHNAYEADLYFGPIRAAMSLDHSTRSGTSTSPPALAAINDAGNG